MIYRSLVNLVILAVVVASLFFSGREGWYNPTPAEAATGEKLDLLVYPSVWTVTESNSGINMIAVKGKNGFSGPVTISVSGLPDNILDRFQTTTELEQGKGGYYCSSHCQAASNADFPVPLTVTDGQWMSFGPTLLTQSTATQTKTVTITATGGGTSVSQSFTLKIIKDRGTIPPEGGPIIPPASMPNPDAYVTLNPAQFNQNLYKVNLTAGQSTTVNFDLVNTSQSSPVTVEPLSNLGPSGVDDITSTITGGFPQSSYSLAAGQTITVPVQLSTQTTTVNGIYELVMGIRQTDGSIRATVGISSIITGGASGATPTPTPTPTETTTSAPPSASPSPSASEASATPSPTVSASTPVAEPTVTVLPTTIPTPTPSVRSSTLVPETHVSDPFDRETVLEPVTQTVLIPAATVGTGLAVVTLGSLIGSLTGGTATAAGSMFAGISSFALMGWNALLEFIGLRRRRYPWGTVFDVATDKPIELAIVRLLNPAGKLVETRVTDQSGRIGFLAHPGIYTLQVVKTGYELATPKEAMGSRYQPLYDGRTLTISPRETAVHVNLPMRTLGEAGHHRFRSLLNLFHKPALFITLPLGLWNYTIFPSVATGAIVVLAGVILLAEWLILRPRGVGLVTDRHHRPLGGIILRLIRETDQKVLETQLTDLTGHFSFLVRPGRYQLRIASPNWVAPAWLEHQVFAVTNPHGGVIDRTVVLTETEK